MDYLVEIKKYIYIYIYFKFSNYRPLQNYTVKICKQDNSESIIGRSFKLSRLIEDDK